MFEWSAEIESARRMAWEFFAVEGWGISFAVSVWYVNARMFFHKDRIKSMAVAVAVAGLIHFAIWYFSGGSVAKHVSDAVYDVFAGVGMFALHERLFHRFKIEARDER